MGSRTILAVIAWLVAAPAVADQYFLSPGAVLNDAGSLRTMGWAPDERVVFNEEDLAVSKKRLRKWDFFTVANARFAANFTLADVGFGRFCSVDLIDFRTGDTYTAFAIPLQAADKLTLSKTTRDSSLCKMGRDVIRFETLPDRRVLTFDLPGGVFSDAMRGKIVLHQPPSHDFLSFVMPFSEDPDAFFYENKIPVLPAEGVLTAGGQTYSFAVTDSFAVMDWGRGVWPAEVTWHWGAAAGRIDGVPVGFNLGYGFGMTAAATENIVVYDGKAHKLGDVRWHFDRDDWMKPWRLESPDGRFEMRFVPVHPQQIDVNLWLYAAKLDKVYGRFTGKIVLDDGRVLQVENLFGFGEEMYIRW